MEGTLSIGKKEKFVLLQGSLVTWSAKKGAKVRYSQIFAFFTCTSSYNSSSFFSSLCPPGAQKNDGECALKAGVTVEAVESGFKLGPDSGGNVVEFGCDKGEAGKWIAAIEKSIAEAATSESEATGEFIRQGWLSRDKKKFFFTLRGGCFCI